MDTENPLTDNGTETPLNISSKQTSPPSGISLEESKINMKTIVIISGILFLFLLAIGVTLFYFWGKNEIPKTKVVNVGMLMASGGLGDRSFNDSAYLGLQDAQNDYNIRFDISTITTEEETLESLRDYARLGYDLIIGIGYENAKNIETVSAEFPDLNFAIIDVEVKGQNVASVVFREQEGDFLMGVLAAMLTKTNKVGFIGGMDIDIIKRIESGFIQGIEYQSDDTIEIFSDFAGTFSDSEVGKSLALAQYSNGVDIIYNAAGRTGLGIIEAAKEVDKLTIGTSGEQIYLAPGNVVGNRPKRVDVAVYNLINDVVNNSFTPGLKTMGLRENGISIGPFDQDIVTEDMLSIINELKNKISSGQITVSDIE